LSVQNDSKKDALSAIYLRWGERRRSPTTFGS
jgi:hypothetical protein